MIVWNTDDWSIDFQCHIAIADIFSSYLFNKEWTLAGQDGKKTKLGLILVQIVCSYFFTVVVVAVAAVGKFKKNSVKTKQKKQQKK